MIIRISHLCLISFFIFHFGFSSFGSFELFVNFWTDWNQTEHLSWYSSFIYHHIRIHECIIRYDFDRQAFDSFVCARTQSMSERIILSMPFMCVNMKILNKNDSEWFDSNQMLSEYSVWFMFMGGYVVSFFFRSFWGLWIQCIKMRIEIVRWRVREEQFCIVYQKISFVCLDVFFFVHINLKGFRPRFLF